MKKFFSILLLVSMIATLLPSQFFILSFAEDTVSEEVSLDDVYAVTEKINGIGVINIFSGNRIKEARTAYDNLDDTQKELVENFSVLEEAEALMQEYYLEFADSDYASVNETTLQYISDLGIPDVASVGGEWMVICLSRSDNECPAEYYENVITFVNENINDKGQLHRAKSTESSRVILALTSLGYDVTNVDGHNLLCGLSDMNYVKRQGVNGPIWALIALDSYGYEIPENSNPDTQATREEIIAYILEKQTSEGGWSIYSQYADPDMTGMAIQALAPYYDSNPEVADAVETALTYLSETQNENGTFGSIDGVCSESCAQVIVALTSLGIDPEEDERFIKNGISVVDALCMFAVDGGGFEHLPESGLNGMATEQGCYALTSYARFLEGKTNLYDMTDVTMLQDETEEEPDDEFVEEDPEIWDDSMVEDDDISDDSEQEEYEETQTEETPAEEDNTKDNQEEQVSSEVTTLPTEPVIQMTDTTFDDVKAADWYFESVKYVYESNLMQGTDNGFEPNKHMTRAMLVTTLYRIAPDKTTDAAHNFSDVPEDSWYSDAVSWAVGNEIVKGISETEFMPDEEITREQMALMLWRYAKMVGMDVSQASTLAGYTDATDVSDWATDAVGWANAVSLVNGTDQTTLSPKGTATRAQVATVLMRFLKMSAN